MFFYDATYILVLIGALLSMWASARVNSTYKKYAQVRSASGLTGAEAARRILNGAGIYDVRIEHISGNLTDHYDPRGKVLRLSAMPSSTIRDMRRFRSAVQSFRWQISGRRRHFRLFFSDCSSGVPTR